MTQPALISSSPDELQEGLFGQIILWTFEILPHLDATGQQPAWAIRSRLYGSGADPVVIPGLLETAYPAPPPAGPAVPLARLRDEHAAILGHDWPYLASLWARYFRFPARIHTRAAEYPSLDQALGLHFRGTDKNRASVETNPVTAEEFLTLAEDFIATHPGITTLYLASDEPAFLTATRLRFPKLQIVASGTAAHHKGSPDEELFAKGDHALLDCLLLSRCRYVLKCQSALSGFAKILNPDLEIYRVSANKLAHWSHGIPYFPDAYLPQLTSRDPACQRILNRLMQEDWTQDPVAHRRYRQVFRNRPRPHYLRLGDNLPLWSPYRLQWLWDRLRERLFRLSHRAKWKILTNAMTSSSSTKTHSSVAQQAEGWRVPKAPGNRGYYKGSPSLLKRRRTGAIFGDYTGKDVRPAYANPRPTRIDHPTKIPNFSQGETKLNLRPLVCGKCTTSKKNPIENPSPS